MAAIMADHNIEGHFRALILIFEHEPWKEIWQELNIAVESFESLGLSPGIGDAELWQTCQAKDIVLLTANRNNGDPDSLEDVVKRYNTRSSPPVLTLANPDRFAQDRAFAEQVAEQILANLMDLDRLPRCGKDIRLTR